jgi:hypothetical protein
VSDIIIFKRISECHTVMFLMHRGKHGNLCDCYPLKTMIEKNDELKSSMLVALQVGFKAQQERVCVEHAYFKPVVVFLHPVTIAD